MEQFEKKANLQRINPLYKSKEFHDTGPSWDSETKVFIFATQAGNKKWWTNISLRLAIIVTPKKLSHAVQLI